MPKEILPTYEEQVEVRDAVIKFRDDMKREPTLKELAPRTKYTFKHTRWVVNKMIKMNMLGSTFVGATEYIGVSNPRKPALPQ